MTAFVAPRPSKSVGQDATLQKAPQFPFGVRRDALLLPVVAAQGVD
jgi:hypothetical protein